MREVKGGGDFFFFLQSREKVRGLHAVALLRADVILLLYIFPKELFLTCENNCASSIGPIHNLSRWIERSREYISPPTVRK